MGSDRSPITIPAARINSVFLSPNKILLSHCPFLQIRSRVPTSVIHTHLLLSPLTFSLRPLRWKSFLNTSSSSAQHSAAGSSSSGSSSRARTTPCVPSRASRRWPPRRWPRTPSVSSTTSRRTMTKFSPTATTPSRCPALAARMRKRTSWRPTTTPPLRKASCLARIALISTSRLVNRDLLCCLRRVRGSGVSASRAIVYMDLTCGCKMEFVSFSFQCVVGDAHNRPLQVRPPGGCHFRAPSVLRTEFASLVGDFSAINKASAERFKEMCWCPGGFSPLFPSRVCVAVRSYIWTLFERTRELDASVRFVTTTRW